jgi:hypothetical protein
MRQTLGNLTAQGIEPTEWAIVTDAFTDAILNIFARYSKKHRCVNGVKRIGQEPHVLDCLAAPRKGWSDALQVKARCAELGFKEILSPLPTPCLAVWRSRRRPGNGVA